MAKTTELRRQALSARLTEAALSRIAEDGLAALRARDLAKDAGCAVGAIYTVFRDLEELILAANAVTFRELGAHVAANVPDGAPLDRLIAMSHAYLGFAEAHTRRWLALFEVSVSADTPLPDWYRAEIAHLFEIIRGPVTELRQDLDDPARELFVRTLFSAVHGVVLLGVQRRISAVPAEDLRPALALLLRSAVRS